MDNRLDAWEKAHKRELQPPMTAWPTVLLFVVALTILALSTALTLTHHLPVLAGLALNAIAQFMCFTVLHDASHRSLSQRQWLNESLGSIAAFILTPLAGVRVFRFIHMQHHRFTNEGLEQDPDQYCGAGSPWSRPFRWLTVDIHYVFWYLSKWSGRPVQERKEMVLTATAGILLLLGLCWLGYGFWVLTLYLIPGRLAMAWLALAFDFLPHYPYDTKASENEFRATNLKPELSWLMTPILLSQNYHLVHHLYPRVPFYRYPWVWHQAKEELIVAGARIMHWNGEEFSPAQRFSQTENNPV